MHPKLPFPKDSEGDAITPKRVREWIREIEVGAISMDLEKDDVIALLEDWIVLCYRERG
jgi:hypothetical protein